MHAHVKTTGHKVYEMDSVTVRCIDFDFRDTDSQDQGVGCAGASRFIHVHAEFERRLEQYRATAASDAVHSGV